MILRSPFLSCENNVLFRGHFNGTGSETSVDLTIYGGTREHTVLSSKVLG